MINKTKRQVELKNNSKSNFDFKTPIEEFIQKKLNGNIKAFEDTTILGNHWIEFISFLKSSDKYDAEIIDRFEDGKDKKYLTFFKKTILETSLPLLNLLKNTTKSFLLNFDLSEEQKNILQQELNKSSVSDLKYYLYSESGREKFLKKINIKVNSKNESERDEKLIKSIFSGSDLQSKVLSKPDLVESIKKFYNSDLKVTLQDLENILNELTDEGKQALLNYFIPTISIEDALKYGFIKDIEANEIIKKELKKFSLDEKEIEDMILSIDRSCFFIETNSLKDGYKIFQNQSIKQKILDEINSLKEDNSKENQKIESFKEFKESVLNNPKISLEIKNNLTKLINGNYIKIYGEKIKPTQYFYINNTEFGEELKTFLFTNITLGTGIQANNKGIEETKTYESFLKLLECISLSNSKAKIEFLTKDDLKDLQKIPDEQEINSKEDLKKFLDEVDLKGSKVPLEKMAFYAEPQISYDENGKIISSTKKDLFYVKSITNEKITLNTGESFDFKTFAQIFKLRKCERFERIDSPKELIEKLASENEAFKDLIFDDDKKIKPKSEKGNKDYPGIDYFIGEKEDSVFINNLKDNEIDFTIGEFKESNDDKKPNIFEGKKKAKGWGFTDFYEEIKEKKLKPYTKNIKTQEKQDDIKSADRKSSLLKGYMSWWSIGEIIYGSKQVISSIEQNLKTGNKLKGAKFALALGKFLPESVRQDLQSIVEQEEKKTMEELLSHLTALDSKVMIPKIVKIITNKSSQQYEVEAALAAMYSKYGTLYNKPELSKYRGTFIWYEALGGKVGDALFLETKKNCEQARALGVSGKNTPKPFTEEYLIEQLLSKQANGELKPKRRSKIHKEMRRHLSNGIKAELEDGANKAGNQITLKGRIDHCINELKNGGFSNGIGALEKIWAKGGSPSEMHAIPFIITITGISKFFPEELLVKMIGGMGRGSAYTELVFNKDAESLTKFKRGIRAIVKSLFHDKSILKELDEIGTDVSKAYEFWRKYGDKIVDRMIGKDGYLFAMKDEDKDLGDYYNFISGMQNDDEYNIKAEDINNGLLSYQNTPFTLTSGRKIYQKFLKFPNGVCLDEGQKLLNNIILQLKELRSFTYDIDPKKDLEIKKKIYKELYILAHASIIKTGSFYKQVLETKEVKLLERNGIDIKGFGKDLADLNTPEGTEDSVYGYTNSEAFQKFLDENFEKYINNNTDFLESEAVVNKTKKSIHDIIFEIDNNENRLSI